MKRALISATIAVAASMGLAACGSSGTTTTVTAAGGETAQKAVADVKVGDTVSLADLSKDSTAAIKNAKSAKLKAVMPGGELTGGVRYDPSLAMSLSGDQGGQQMSMIYIDKVLYVGGQGVSEMAGGKKFIKIDPAGTDPMSKLMAPMLNSMEQAADPSAMFAEITDVQAKVTKVDGGNVTYASTLSADQAKKVVMKSLKDSPLADAAAAKVTGMSVEQTLDAKGLPVQVVVKQDGQEAATTSYSDWGSDVTIEAPPAGDVGTASMG